MATKPKAQAAPSLVLESDAPATIACTGLDSKGLDLEGYAIPLGTLISVCPGCYRKVCRVKNPHEGDYWLFVDYPGPDVPAIEMRGEEHSCI